MKMTPSTAGILLYRLIRPRTSSMSVRPPEPADCSRTRKSFAQPPLISFEHGISAIHLVRRFRLVLELEFELDRTSDSPGRILTDARPRLARGRVNAPASLVVGKTHSGRFARAALYRDGFSLGLKLQQFVASSLISGAHDHRSAEVAANGRHLPDLADRPPIQGNALHAESLRVPEPT